LKFYLKSWGLEGSEDLSVQFTEIETRPCEQGDLAQEKGSDKDTGFFPMKKDAQDFIDGLGTSSLLCAKNLSDLALEGNYDTSSARNVMVAFEKCHETKSEV